MDREFLHDLCEALLAPYLQQRTINTTQRARISCHFTFMQKRTVLGFSFELLYRVYCHRTCMHSVKSQLIGKVISFEVSSLTLFRKVLVLQWKQNKHSLWKHVTGTIKWHKKHRHICYKAKLSKMVKCCSFYIN